VAAEARMDADTTIRSLRDVLINLKTVDAPKTLMLVSQGFHSDIQRDQDINHSVNVDSSLTFQQRRVQADVTVWMQGDVPPIVKGIGVRSLTVVCDLPACCFGKMARKHIKVSKAEPKDFEPDFE
jgi:hypothetical protein